MKQNGLSTEEITVYHQIEHALTDDRPQLLIVGGRTSNWNRELLQHPLLRFPDRNDPKALRLTEFPRRVGCVILTRFMSHSEFERIKSLVPRDALLIPRTYSTGIIRRILHRLIQQSSRFTQPAAAAPEEEPMQLALKSIAKPTVPHLAETEDTPTRFTPTQMLRTSAVLEPILAGIDSHKDAQGVVSGKACGKVITEITHCEQTAAHIKLLISCEFLAPVKAEGGKRFTRYRVTDEAAAVAKLYRDRTAGPTPTEIAALARRLDDYTQDRTRVAEIARRLLPIIDEFRDLLTRLAH